MLSNVLVVISCWHERHRDVLHGMHSPLATFCLTFKYFWLWLMVIVPIICLKDVFLRKVMTGVALNTFRNVLLIFDICQCLLIISLMFGKVELYVTKNGITFFCAALVVLLPCCVLHAALTELTSPGCLLFWFGFEWCFLCTLFPRIV